MIFPEVLAKLPAVEFTCSFSQGCKKGCLCKKNQEPFKITSCRGLRGEHVEIVRFLNLSEVVLRNKRLKGKPSRLSPRKGMSIRGEAFSLERSMKFWDGKCIG